MGQDNGLSKFWKINSEFGFSPWTEKLPLASTMILSDHQPWEITRRHWWDLFFFWEIMEGVQPVLTNSR
ncbi:hypothetical protein RHMOL_Rhmol05G0025800 [Rhododendron molle]|uniref:Uncharacterized protein n=1 Tax=Rhododendron molle TaxID=49168 RepID=A0ACC0NJN5_RHOML|nr:hypothetical protein RHMOL_Rhmol05G0025800 [Rhododendron molle]